MSEPILHRYSRRLSPADRGAALDRALPDTVTEEVVVRADGGTIDIAVLDALMDELYRRRDAGQWTDDRASVDRWLAPRVHHALRLTRELASDRTLWEWLAVRYANHTYWRWFDKGLERGSVGISEDRWWGPIHKQVMARLWWGAELFRDGADYRPVERAFVRQDLINSYLHRPLVRCRSLGLGILDVVAPDDDLGSKTANDVNSLARVLNLATAGAPPELETEFQQDDWSAFAAWAGAVPELPDSWDPLPEGPRAEDTTEESLAGGRAIAERGWRFAEAAR
jgi:hypothetical protein